MEAFAFGHIALIALAVVIGVARVVAWVLDWREYSAAQPYRQAQVVTLAQLEIAASKRGDLQSAARYAEQQEATHA